MTTQGEYHGRRFMGLQQLYWNILTALLLASLINEDYGAHGQRHPRDFRCKEEGYHADPHNCQMYYRCVSWGNGSPLTKFDFKCGPGTVFSHASGDICVHPRDSERTDCYGSGNDLDSNFNYPQSNEPPTYQHPHESPSYGIPPDEPSYGQPDYGSPPSSPSYVKPPVTPYYESTQPSPNYQQPYPTPSSSSTESPFINEIDQSAYLPPSQSPPSSSSQSPSLATTSENYIPHPISTTPVAGTATGQFECHQEGFFAHPNKCEKFIRCVDDGHGSYLKYDFTCGEGTVWDPSIVGCNHAWAVNRDGCSTSSQDGDSNGNNGQDIDQSQSGGGDLDNDITSSSPWRPEATQAPSYPSYPPSESPNGNPVSSAPTTAPSSSEHVPPSEATSQSPSSSSSPSSTSQETEHSTSIPPSFTSSPSSGNVGNGSPPESSSTSPGSTTDSSLPSSDGCTEEGFFADPNDCTKFYRCVREESSLKKYDFTCGEGTAWDQGIQTCNHKYAVSSCSGKDHTSDQTSATNGGDAMKVSSEPDKSKETSTEDEGENQSGVTNSPSSSEVPTTAEEVSSPSSASEVPTTVEESSQPSSSTEVSTTVEESSNAPSESTQESEAITESGVTSQSTTADDAPSATTTSSSEPDKDQETSTQETGGNQSEATNSSSPSTTSESAVEETSSPSSPSSTTEESSSLKPEETSESSSPPREPSSTASTSPDKPNGPSENSDCREEGFFPDPTDCHKFYRCVSTGDDKFTKYIFDCAPGTAWDQSILTCNYIEKVASCGSGSNEIPSGPEENEKTSIKPTSETIPTSTPLTTPKDEQGNETDVTPTTNNTKEENSTTKPSSSTDSNNVESNESTSKSPDNGATQKTDGSSNCTTTKPPTNEIVCDDAGFYANPLHCNKFYRCVDNGNGFNVYHFDCPPGTIFDPSISVCNYPESVYPPRNCDGGEVGTAETTTQIPSVTEATKTPSTTTELSAETPATTETSSQSGTESTGIEETSTESTSEVIGGEETSTESATEVIGVDETSTESVTEVTGVEETSPGSTTEPTATTENAAEPQTTVDEGATSTATEAGVTAPQTTTELVVESSVTPESTITTEAISESSSTVTEIPTEATDNQESTTPQLGPTTEGKMKVDNVATPCSIGNLTEEQIVLVCPTGFRRHPKYCNMFYQCSNDEEMKINILVLSCPEGTIYDEEKIQCRPESESSQACDTQLASSRVYRQLEKSSTSPIRVRRNVLCPGDGHYPYQHGCSNAFYKCKKNTRNELQGYLYRCPKDFVYWSVSRRCERPNRMICSHGKYEDNERIYSWENRWELPIEQSNLSS